jgi:hypothetical protein
MIKRMKKIINKKRIIIEEWVITSARNVCVERQQKEDNCNLMYNSAVSAKHLMEKISHKRRRGYASLILSVHTCRFREKA